MAAGIFLILAASRSARRDNQMHIGHLARGVGVDRAQLAVRKSAAHHHAIESAGEVQIVGIAALAAQQDRILLARYGLADGKFRVCQERGVERRIHQGFGLPWPTPYPKGYSDRPQPGPARPLALQST